MGYIWQNYGIYWSIGFILQKLSDVLAKLWDIWGKNYGIYYGIYLLIAIGYICQNVRGILGEIMGYIMGYDCQYF